MNTHRHFRFWPRIIVTISLALSGCHAKSPDYSLSVLPDGSQVRITPLDSAQGRADEARERKTNQFIYRYRVTPNGDHPVVRCELELYRNGEKEKVPLAHLDHQTSDEKPLDVVVSIGPMNAATQGTGEMHYSIRIGDKSRTSTGIPIFRGLTVQRAGARNLPPSYGDRWYLVAGNRDPKKESGISPKRDDMALVFHIATLPKAK